MALVWRFQMQQPLRNGLADFVGGVFLQDMPSNRDNALRGRIPAADFRAASGAAPVFGEIKRLLNEIL